MTAEPDYGNWIRERRVVLIAEASVLAAGAAALLWSRWALAGMLAAVTAVILVALASYLGYLRLQFSDRGLGLQRVLWSSAVDGLDWDGRGLAVDIGTGNGALAILVAERFPRCRVIGVDTWAPGWGYSRATCEANAELRGVADRVEFRPASATALPFDDCEVDAAVSHFVFHEVGGVDGAAAALVEALRVVRPGGAFSFQDMFDDPGIYPSADGPVAALLAAGAADVTMTPVDQLTSLPPLLRGRRALGAAARASGHKRCSDA